MNNFIAAVGFAGLVFAYSCDAAPSKGKQINQDSSNIITDVKSNDSIDEVKGKDGEDGKTIIITGDGGGPVTIGNETITAPENGCVYIIDGKKTVGRSKEECDTLKDELTTGAEDGANNNDLSIANLLDLIDSL